MTPASRASASSRLADEVVGREAERAAIAAFLDAATAGPAGLLLEGDAGIGKTTLFRAGVAMARARGAGVLVCRPIESEARYAYAALGDLLDGVPDDVLGELPPPQRRAVEVALLRAEPDDDALLPRAVALGVLGVLRALSAGAPTLVAIDDVQWIDRPSRTALEFVARRLDTEPVGVLLTRRNLDDPVAATPADPTVLAGAPMRRLRIEPLDVDQLAVVVRERLGVSLPRPVIARFHRTAGGNPFYALEIARASLAAGGDAVEPVIPASLQELVTDRLTALPPGACEAMELTAALSRATIDVLDAAMDGAARAGVAEAVAAGALEIDGARVCFAHPLVQSVAYARIPGERRCELHARLAAVLRDPEERGRHLALSTTQPDAAVALALDEAARRARARGAPDAAAELLADARRLTPPDRERDAHRRGVEAASHYFEAGNVARAESLLRDLAASAPSSNDRAAALARLGWLQAHSIGQHAADMSWRAAQAERPTDPAVCIEIELGLAWSVHSTASAADALLHARAALDLAESIGDQALVAGALSSWALLDSLGGHGVALDAAARAAALGPSAIWSQILGRSDWVHALLLQWSGDLEGARRRFTELLDDATANGDEHALPAILFQLARIALLEGDWDVAEAHARACLEVTERSGHVGERPYALTIVALVDAHRGRVEPARTEIAEAVRLAEQLGAQPAGLEARAALGFLELSLGEHAAAAATLGSLHAAADRAGFRDPANLRFQADEIEALLAAGAVDEGTARSAELDRVADRLDRPPVHVLAGRSRGLVLAARGDLAGAQRALGEALAAAEGGEPFERARTLHALGVVQRRDKQKRAARESLDAARQAFERLGAPLWVARAEAELARVGGRGAGDEALTETERRVAELIAAGRTYREAAAELFISPKTVQWNLSKVYRKLRIRSRAELPARLAATGD